MISSSHASNDVMMSWSGDVPTISELVDRADDELFEKVLCNPHHVLYNSLPNETVSFYELRYRPHNRELVNKTSRLSEASFIVRMLYKDILVAHFCTILLLRSLDCFSSIILHFIVVTLRFVKVL